MVRTAILAALLSAAACAAPVEIDVSLVDPCTQDAIGSVQFLRFEPRGAGVDSAALTRVVRTDGEGFEPLDLPRSASFSLAVTGHRDEMGQPEAIVRAQGASAEVDLTNASGPVSIRLPFALVDSFYRTTRLDADGACSEMQVARFGATATYLPVNGQVLIVGGAQIVADAEGGHALAFPAAVELFDPRTGTFRVVADLAGAGVRRNHTATPLGGGRVLIAGGEGPIDGTPTALRSAFVIDASDPDAVTLPYRGLEMRSARTGHQAAALPDGRVVLVGGRQLLANAADPRDHSYLDGIEVFDPAQLVFTLPAGADENAIHLGSARYGHSVTAFPGTAQVLVAGGMNQDGTVLDLELLRIDDVSSVTQIPGGRLGVGPVFHAATPLDDSEILLSGGYARIDDAEPSELAAPMPPSAQVEVWSLAEGELRLRCTDALNQPRALHTATAVGGRALFVGGRGADRAALGVAEIATTSRGSSCFRELPHDLAMEEPRVDHAVAALDAGGLLVVGGRQEAEGAPLGRSLAFSEVFSASPAF